MATVVDPDVVADAVDWRPSRHWKCAHCYPEDGPGTKAICGAELLGIVPPPGSVMCDECDLVTWIKHLLKTHGWTP
jgi:hypothetical protein